MTREIVLCVKILNQVASVDVEKSQESNILLYAPDLDSTMVQFFVEERVYKLERDEDAMLARIKNTNIRAQGVDSFLFQRLGLMADLQNDQQMTLNTLIDKKRVFVGPSKVISVSRPFVLQSLLNQDFVAAADHIFGCQVDAKCNI